MTIPRKPGTLINSFGCLLLFLLCFVPTAIAQNPSVRIDSLQKKASDVYKHNPQQGIAFAQQAYLLAAKERLPRQELTNINTLTFFYWGIQDFKNARIFSQRGLSVAKANYIDSLAGDFLVLTGAIDHVNNNYNQAIANYQQAVTYYKKNNLQKRIGNAYVNIGICQIRLSRFEAANGYFLQSANIFHQLKDTLDLSATYNSMGACFSSLSELKKSEEYYRKALALRQKIGDKSLTAQSLNNLGFAFTQDNQPDSAIYYLSKCLAMRRNEKDSNILVLTLQNLGNSLKMKGNLKKAEAYITRSLKIAANYNMKEDAARGNLDLANIYLAQKKYKPALTTINLTENAARQLKLPELLMNAYAVKFSIFTQINDYKNALLYDNKKSALKDSLFSIEKSKAISELEIKYQTTQKENDIAALNRQNTLQNKIVKQQKLSIIVLIIAAILLFMFFVIAYNSFRIKNKANQRIQTLMKDLHHRVKNNLQILSGLFTMQIESLSDEQSKAALRENETRLTSMNLIHHKLYHDHSTTQIEMKEYLTKLLQHIKASFGGDKAKNIELKIEISPLMLEADKAVAIGLIVNELATNAFKYAFDEKPGEIYLGIQKSGKSKIVLSLHDNGKGIPHVHKKDEVSFGLKLVNLMTRQLGAQMTFNTDNGTSYKFEINI